MIGVSIWVPSLERDVRFRDLTMEQVKDLTRASHLNIGGTYNEFLFALNHILYENVCEGIEIPNLTIMDRFLIFLRLKQVSDTNVIRWTFDCPECGEPVKSSLRIDHIMKALVGVFDRRVRSTMNVGNTQVDLGLMTLATERKLIGHLIAQEIIDPSKILEWQSENYDALVIQRIITPTATIAVDEYDIEARVQLLNQLPWATKPLISQQFIAGISKEIELQECVCKSEGCGYSFKMTLNLWNLTDILKLAVTVNVDNWLYLYRMLSTHGNVSLGDFKEMTPGEVSILYQSIENEFRERNSKTSPNRKSW